MPDKITTQNRVSSIPHWPQPAVTARERFSRCTGLSLRFRGQIPLHRYIYQAKMGSRPNAASREREYRTENHPLPLSRERRAEWTRPSLRGELREWFPGAAHWG